MERRTAGEDLANEYYLTAKSLYFEVLSSYPRFFLLFLSFALFLTQKIFFFFFFFGSDSEAQLNLAVTLTKILNLKYNEQPFPSDDGFPFSLPLPTPCFL